MTDQTTFGLLVPGAGQAITRPDTCATEEVMSSAEANNTASERSAISGDHRAELTSDDFVCVAERWTKMSDGAIIHERKIGGGDWERVDNPYWHRQEPAIRMDWSPLMGYSGMPREPIKTKIEAQAELELARSIHENGWSSECSFIEVWHTDDNSPAILCGRHDYVTNWKFNSGHFCCKWAGDMYWKYIEQREDER